MVTVPYPTPVTLGCVAGAIRPTPTVAVDVTVASDVLLLLSVTVVPPVGAAGFNVTASVCAWPRPAITLGASVMVPGGVTVTLADVAAIPEALLAVIIALPAATPVTVTVVVVWPTANVAVAGTVAMLVLLELRLTVTPPVGAAPDNVRVKVPVPAPPIIVRDDGL
jgi:hypothetical protein